ncbi:HNH endonuclease [Mesorhizobium waimense]|uniref:HNH endonuclease n=1 Tax=Mesorhizobium waimense TaxID=1300307 RepID=A0A3A5KEK8_9HYPH|nr:HNH endonuclease [Mesorhizobium waimense]
MIRKHSHSGRTAEATEYRRLYSTARWRQLRLAKLSQDPLCEWCLEREVIEPATEVHHADGGHKGDVTKFWSGPFISTCKPCHASRGQREDNGQQVIRFSAYGWPI